MPLRGAFSWFLKIMLVAAPVSKVRTPHRVPPRGRRAPAVESIRRKCLERIKQARAARVWEKRRVEESSPFEARARLLLDDVLAWTKPEEERWSTDSHSSAANSMMEEELRITPDEEAELMLELEAELRKAEEREASAYAAELDLEQSCLEAAAEAYERSGEDDVLCPVCSQGSFRHRVRESSQTKVFECEHCGIAVADACDGLGLGHLRLLLARCFEDHRLTGCDARPTFMVDPRFGGLLLCRCSSCPFQSVVM